MSQRAATWNHDEDPFAAGFLQLVQKGADAVLLAYLSGAASDHAVTVTIFANTSTEAFTAFTFVGFDPSSDTRVPPTDTPAAPKADTDNETTADRGGDTLTGGEGDGTTSGGNGDERSTGGEGGETASGGETTLGGEDGDTLAGGESSETTHSGEGNEMIDGSPGSMRSRQKSATTRSSSPALPIPMTGSRVRHA